MSSVIVVSVGSDSAVYLNGHFVISADPGSHDNPAAVEQVATSLATMHGVTVEHIDHKAINEDWNWNDDDIESLVKYTPPSIDFVIHRELLVPKGDELPG